MDMPELVDALCRAWRPDFDQELTAHDDFTLSGMTDIERRELRSRMRRLARAAVIPLLQANRPMDPVSGRLVERRRNPFLQANQPADMALGRFVERRKTVSSEQPK